MKKLNILSITACLIPLMFSSCKKVLEKQDLGSFTADQVYNDSTTTKLSVDYIYSQNQPAWFGNTGGLSGSVNSLAEEVYGDNVFVKGTATIESVTDIGAINTSGNYFKIRTINMFIRDVNAGTMDPA
ncbi:MAG: RagB/SusD family nutrient uptake outer membrane protein, partial [Pedobacter sp.]|nr:RagB/SusD family nutrient uptake outer membrane protein [Pedobacter sp.]